LITLMTSRVHIRADPAESLVQHHHAADPGESLTRTAPAR
jgi:hypothetical protein